MFLRFLFILNVEALMLLRFLFILNVEALMLLRFFFSLFSLNDLERKKSFNAHWLYFCRHECEPAVASQETTTTKPVRAGPRRAGPGQGYHQTHQ